MSYRPRSWHDGGGFLGFPPAISQLVLINIIVYLLVPMVFGSHAPSGLALIPAQVMTRGMVWELVSYMFLHANFMHIFFNMFGLVIFGADLERWWGTRDFLKYYFVCGAGAGIIQVLVTYAHLGSPLVPVIGASGAIFGVLVAYALAFPNRQVLLWFVIPVSARTMVILFGLLELFSAASQPHGGGGVARFAHLGGMLVGYLYLKHETLTWKVKRWWGGRGSAVGSFRPRRPSEEDPRQKERIDAILDKISREGMGSLTREERKLLAESADRARRRQQGGDT